MPRSMASVLLITLAASRVSALQGLMSPRIVRIGDHVTGLLAQWVNIPGRGTSPSIMESIKLIENVSALLTLS